MRTGRCVRWSGGGVCSTANLSGDQTTHKKPETQLRDLEILDKRLWLSLPSSRSLQREPPSGELIFPLCNTCRSDEGALHSSAGHVALAGLMRESGRALWGGYQREWIGDRWPM